MNTKNQHVITVVNKSGGLKDAYCVLCEYAEAVDKTSPVKSFVGSYAEVHVMEYRIKQHIMANHTMFFGGNE